MHHASSSWPQHQSAYCSWQHHQRYLGVAAGWPQPAAISGGSSVSCEKWLNGGNISNGVAYGVIGNRLAAIVAMAVGCRNIAAKRGAGVIGGVSEKKQKREKKKKKEKQRKSWRQNNVSKCNGWQWRMWRINGGNNGVCLSSAMAK
jgi:hypothetical protein